MNVLRSVMMLLAFLALCFAVAGIGAAKTYSSIATWYAGLDKPSFTPPNWIFAPVWTLLYVMMAVSAWLVWKKRGFGSAALPFFFFALQLILNGLWSWIFFGMHLPGAAFAEIVFLWCAILAAMLSFWKVSPFAGGLLLPYLLWVSFAGFLNFAIWRLNR